jgi:hypothetical protein
LSVLIFCARFFVRRFLLVTSTRFTKLACRDLQTNIASTFNEVVFQTDPDKRSPTWRASVIKFRPLILQGPQQHYRLQKPFVRIGDAAANGGPSDV